MIDNHSQLRIAKAIKEKCGEGHRPCRKDCEVYSDTDCIDRIMKWLSDIENCTNDIWSWNETYSDDWIHGTFSSREEAIEDALATKKAWNITDKLMGAIHIGKCEYVPVPTSVDVERVLEDINEQYCGETGCENYIYDGVSDKDIEWLEDKLSGLMCEFHQRIKLQPGWFRVVEQEEMDLSEYE